MILKQNGVYLLTGGAGGLGYLLAEYLAKQVKAKLVLTGRSALSETRSASMQSLKTLGSEVIYFQADVSKREEVNRLITKAKSHFNQINGIIHCAGVLKDARLLNKTAEDMKAVLAPKVHGTLYLDEATKTESLDFFVLFSSVTAEMGRVYIRCG
jgi:polyketide synthase PksN